MFFIPEWLRGFWTPKSTVDPPAPTASSESSFDSEMEAPVVRPDPVKSKRRPAKAKGRKAMVAKASQRRSSTLQSSGIDQAEPVSNSAPMTSEDPRYDMMVFRTREIVKRYELVPLLRDSVRRFKTVRELVRFLASGELERLFANLFPIFCSKPSPCPVTFAVFKPILMGISAMQQSGSVRLSYVTYHGRKKSRLHFVNLAARTLWFSELLDLIETATDIALLSCEEGSGDPVKTSSESEAGSEQPSTPVLPATPPLPDPSNPLADTIKETFEALA